VNVLRILMQIVHFFYAYLHVTKSRSWKTVTIAIPTGACGNLTSGYMAHLMGLPIKLLAAVNENDIVSRWINTGVFTIRERDLVQSTISPAIDILVPYNWERILYYISNCDTAGVTKCVNDFEQHQHAVIPIPWMTKLRETISSSSIPQSKSKNMIQYFYNNFNYLLDPHTSIAATAVLSSQDIYNPDHCYICLSTAAPFKFSNTINDILGISLTPLTPYQKYEKQMKKDQNWEEILREQIIQITNNSRKSKL